MTERARDATSRDDRRRAPDAPRPAPPGPASAVLALQRLAGNRATTALVQRQIVDRSKRRKTWSELEQVGTIAKATKAVYFVIRFWAESDTDPPQPVEMRTAGGLVDEARKAVPTMPDEFADSLRTRDELDQFNASVSRLKLTLAQSLVDALQRRAHSFGHQFVHQLPPGYTLPTPHLDPRYSTPSGWSSQTATTTGRDDAGWHSVQNTMTGLGGQHTGSVNLWLGQEEQRLGGLTNVGGSLMQVCATCGRLSDATMFEVDHQQAFSDIRDNLLMLASAMALDAKLYKQIAGASSPGLFVVSGTPGQTGASVQPSRQAMNLFSNDLDNLMRICRKCNGPWGKSDLAIRDWYARSPFFGPRFLQEHDPGSKQVIERSKSGEGWGKVARAWFAEHHLPILKEQFTLARIGDWVHGMLTRQTQTQLESRYEPDPVKQSNLRQQSETLGGTSRAFLGGMEVDQSYFSGQLLGHEPTPMRPGSPGLWQQQHVEQARRREERIEQERVKGSDPYRLGYAQVLGMQPADERPYAHDQWALGAYRQGRQEGEQAVRQAQATGRGEGWSFAFTTDPNDYAQAIQDLARRSGFVDVVVRRSQVWASGRDRALQGFTPDLSAVPRGGDGGEQLLRDYMDGWNAGLAEWQRPPTPQPQTPQGGTGGFTGFQ